MQARIGHQASYDEEKHVGERVQVPPGGREEQGLQHNFPALGDLAEARRAKADPGEI